MRAEPAMTVHTVWRGWSHEHVVWWAVLLRRWGYCGHLPRWAVHTCTAVYPAEFCVCGLYRMQWRDVGG